MRPIPYLGLLLALTLLGCQSQVKAEQAPDSPSSNSALSDSRVRKVQLDVETAKSLGIRSIYLREGSSVATISVPGSMEYHPDLFAEVGPRLDGRIISLKAKVGDVVKAGTVLATLAVPSLAEAQAASLMASATLHAAEKNVERERALIKKQLTTAREAEVAESELIRAKASLAAADARLRALGVSRHGVAGTMTLVSPIDGLVVQRTAVNGAPMLSSQSAFAIADLSKLMATFEVHESDLPNLQIGSAVQFRADSLPGRTFTGKLTYIDPMISKATRLVRARIEVDNTEAHLRPGMFIRALIALPSIDKKGSLRIPAEAVQPLGNDDVAFIEVGGGEYEIRTLKLGRRTAQVFEVLSGIKVGEQVVVEGAFLLRAEAGKQ